MRRIIASILILITLFSFSSCSYRVKNEGKAEKVYTCPSDNMFGLEKAVIFSDGIVLVFDKKASDASDHVEFKDCVKEDELYGGPVQMFGGSYIKPHVSSSFEEKNGKYIASAFFYGDEDTTDFVIKGMTVFAKKIDVDNGSFTLSYDDYESVTDGYLVIEQHFDAASGKWGEVENDFVSCWSEG